ncbi:MAG TPA: response regulator transcription factor [Candidatus Binatia bacterium]|nr:response regulator transcription factor [Candidatus Binatia bacterium]
MPVVFFIEGGSGMRQIVQPHLERAGFLTQALSAEANIVQRAQQIHPALIMIDTMVGGGRGIERCRKIRAVQTLSRTPVILLAAKSSEEERVAGLEAGADDYISDFSSGREIIARLQAVVRRFSRLVPCAGIPQPSAAFANFLAGTASTIKTGDIEIDTSSMRVMVRGSEIATTTLEFRLIYYLSHHRACVFSRDQLLDAVWGTQYVSPRTVDACVRRLRHKLEPNRSSPTYLKTIRGAGYCLDPGIGQA